MSRKIYHIERVAAIIAAAILIQTLYFKFTGHPESVRVFSDLGIEPYGRIGLGVIELITALMILIPRTAAHGGLLGSGIMLGAIASHFFILGIEVNNDKGMLFIMAIITFICCLIVLFSRKDQIGSFIRRDR